MMAIKFTWTGISYSMMAFSIMSAMYLVYIKKVIQDTLRLLLTQNEDTRFFVLLRSLKRRLAIIYTDTLTPIYSYD